MMQNATRVLWNDGGVKGLYGEDGTTELNAAAAIYGRTALSSAINAGCP
jgi:hypothetical protein